MTKLEMERISLIPLKINYSQSSSPALKVIHNMIFFYSFNQVDSSFYYLNSERY